MKKNILLLILLTIFTINFSACEKNISDEKITEEKNFPEVKILNIWENFSKNFSTLWEVFPEKESIFTSKISDWIVKKIYVKNWDKVKKWQLLIELKSDKTSQNYKNAVNNYQKAVNSWKQSVKSAETNLENAKNIYEKQKIEFENSLSSSKTKTKLSIEKAEADLKSIIALNQKTEKSAKENLENFFKTAKITSENSLNEIDKILWIEDVNKENALKYENYLWTLKSETLTNSETNYRIAKNNFSNWDFSNYDSVLKILESVKKSANSNLILLQNSTTWPNFTNSELQSSISHFSTLTNSLQSSINNLISLENSFNSVVESNNKNLISAKNALEIAKMSSWENWISESIKLAESSFEKNLTNLENSIKTAQENLNSAKTSSQKNISSALSNLKNAKLSLADLKIKADFNWEISNIFVENWSNISVWTKLIQISNNAKFKIITYLSKDQISWISEWDEVQIWIKSKDKIFTISSVADSSTKKFKVEILHENPFLSPWQFIDLKFFRKNFKTQDSNKIFLDLPAVFVIDSENFVWVVENLNWNIWEILKKKVEIWSLSWNKIEIISWLKIWDKVIVSWWRFLKKDWEKVKILN